MSLVLKQMIVVYNFSRDTRYTFHYKTQKNFQYIFRTIKTSSGEYWQYPDDDLIVRSIYIERFFVFYFEKYTKYVRRKVLSTFHHHPHQSNI